jgi:hypothetical protein
VVSDELLLARMKSRQFMDRAPCAGVYVDLIPYIPARLDRLQGHDLIVMGVPIPSAVTQNRPMMVT